MFVFDKDVTSISKFLFSQDCALSSTITLLFLPLSGAAIEGRFSNRFGKPRRDFESKFLVGAP